MSLHFYKLLQISTEDSSINSYNDYFKKMCKSHKSAMLSTEDSRNKWYTEHEFCIKTVHLPPPKKKKQQHAPHTHTSLYPPCTSSLDNFQELPQDDVRKLVNNMPNKNCLLQGVSKRSEQFEK